MTPNAREKGLVLLVCAALAATTLFVFWGARRCDFVNYDDPAYVWNDEVQKGLNAGTIKWAFGTDAASNWHPLTWISHLADVSMFGRAPAGHHLTSVLIHTANGVLLFLLLYSMTGAIWRCALVAALFSLHPLRVESVVWISERKDVLSTFFWILTVWAYVAWVKSGDVAAAKKKLWYAVAILCYALGLMSKPMLVTLPIILLLVDYWPLKRTEAVGKLLIEKIPFFALAAASCVVTFIVQRRGGAVAPIAGVPIAARVENALISHIRYVAKFFWPSHLSPLYPHPGYWPLWQVAGAILLLTLVTTLVFQQRRTRPYLAVGWGWFVVMLFPTIGIVQVGIQSMADRYTYVPSVGLSIALVWAAAEIAVIPRALKWMAAVAALAACLVLTPRQTRNWRNSETLFKHAMAVTADNYLACNNLGTYLSDRGDKKGAIACFQKALAINPGYYEGLNNLGFALAGQGDYAAATNQYIKALSINPRLTEAHNNLGIALAHLGNNAAAIHEFQVALQERPHYADAHNSYGVSLAMMGKLDDAIAQFREAISDKPDYSSAHSDLGNALAMKGDFDGAIREYQTCIAINRNEPMPHNNLANALAQKGRLKEAVEEYWNALELKPDNPETHFNLGCCLTRLGRNAEAKAQFQIALEERPGYAEARQQLDILNRLK